MLEEKPRYQHDCDKCTFLGRHIGEDGVEYDLYVHWEGEYIQKTVIARYGDDGPEYLSGIPAVVEMEPLREALARAIEFKVVPRKIGIPLSVRRAFRDDDAAMDLFAARFKKLWPPLLYEANTPFLRDKVRALIKELWNQCYAEGLTEVPANKMPKFEIIGQSITLDFRWVDQQIGVRAI